MKTKPRLSRLLALLVLLSLMATGCVRPFASDDDGADLSQVSTSETTPPENGSVPPVEGQPAVPADGASVDGEQQNNGNNGEATTGYPTEAEAESPRPEDGEATTGVSEEGVTEENVDTAVNGETPADTTTTTTPPETTAETTAEGYPASAETVAETPTEPETVTEETTTTEPETATSTDTDAEGENSTAEAGSETPTETTAETTTPATPAATNAEGDIVHVVQAGENLYRIGLLYNVSWQILADYNELSNPNGLLVGTQVLVPTEENKVEADPAPTPTPVPTDGQTHTVNAGDTLFKIGQQYDVDWRQIAEANGIVNPNRIIAGTVLKIPSSSPGPSPEFTHEVQRGETLFTISLRYGVTWNAIAEANELESPYVIFPGDVLTIPGN